MHPYRRRCPSRSRGCVFRTNGFPSITLRFGSRPRSRYRPLPGDERAPSPVSGEVSIRDGSAPPKAYAAEHDHLISIDTGDTVARLLHVDPAVEPGERSLSGIRSVRWFARAFSRRGSRTTSMSASDALMQNLKRASGSLPVDVAADVTPVFWDGTGTVVDGGETWARLDERDLGPGWLACRTPTSGGDGSGVLDGRAPYACGGRWT